MTDLPFDHNVPATPVYTVVITSNGATLDGELVVPLPGYENDARMAALAEIRARAAFRGRPVRVTAKEPTGIVKHFVLTGDGELTVLPYAHPAPPPPVPNDPPITAPPHPGPVAFSEGAWRQQADASAQRYEQRARATHGANSHEVTRWARVRHQLRWSPTPWAASTDLWVASIAEGLLNLPANSPELKSAARTAYACWIKITDPLEAADTGPRLLAALKELGAVELYAEVQRWTEIAVDRVARWEAPAPERRLASVADQEQGT